MLVAIALNGPKSWNALARFIGIDSASIRRIVPYARALGIITANSNHLCLDARFPAWRELKALLLCFSDRYAFNRENGSPPMECAREHAPHQPSRDPFDYLFCSGLRTRCLLLLAAAGQIDAGTASRVLGEDPSFLARFLSRCVCLGAVRSRKVSVYRVYSFDSTFFAARELNRLLKRMLVCRPEYFAVAKALQGALAAAQWRANYLGT